MFLQDIDKDIWQFYIGVVLVVSYLAIWGVYRVIKHGTWSLKTSRQKLAESLGLKFTDTENDDYNVISGVYKKKEIRIFDSFTTRHLGVNYYSTTVLVNGSTIHIGYDNISSLELREILEDYFKLADTKKHHWQESLFQDKLLNRLLILLAFLIILAVIIRRYSI